MSIGFVLLVAAGIILWMSRRDFRLLAAGLIALGIVEGLYFVAYEVMRESDMEDFMRRMGPWLSCGAMFVILVGVIKGMQGSHGRSSSGGAAAHAVAEGSDSFLTPRNDTNSYTRAEALRDQLYNQFEEVAKARGLASRGYKSHNQAPSVWVKFVFSGSQPVENLSLPGTIVITIERFDYHIYELLLTIELSDSVRKKMIFGVTGLENEDISAIIDYLISVTRSSVPKLRAIRNWPWQLWRPKNKVNRFKKDWIAIGGFAIAIIVIPIPIIGWLVAIGIFVFLTIRASRIKYYVLTTGKPLADPRILRRLDFWQANISGLGPYAAEIRNLLQVELATKSGQTVRVQGERIWYHGVDGKVEREQIVVARERAMGFVHIEAYQDELYAGWDTHVNVATWVEQTLARGIDRNSEKYVVANRVVAGTLVPSEFDINDANFLTEWLHSNVVKVLRLKMEEHKIDQEIDFAIQRESRKSVLDDKSGAADGEGGMRGRGLLSRLKRVG